MFPYHRPHFSPRHPRSQPRRAPAPFVLEDLIEPEFAPMYPFGRPPTRSHPQAQRAPRQAPPAPRNAPAPQFAEEFHRRQNPAQAHSDRHPAPPRRQVRFANDAPVETSPNYRAPRRTEADQLDEIFSLLGQVFSDEDVSPAPPTRESQPEPSYRRPAHARRETSDVEYMMDQFGLGDLLQPRRSIPTPQRRPVSRPGPSRQSVSRDDDVLGFGDFLGELFGLQPEVPSRRAAPPTATTTVRPSAPSSAPRARPAVPAQPANAGPEDLLMQMLGAFSEAVEQELVPALAPAPEQHRVQSRHPAFTQPSFAPATAAASQARPAQPTTAKPVPASSSSPFPTPGRTSSHISPNPHNARAGAHNVRPGAADEVADIKEAIRRSLDPRENVQGASTSVGAGATTSVRVQPAPVVTPVKISAAAPKEGPTPVKVTKTTNSSNASPRSSTSMPIPSPVSSSPRPVSHPAPKITRVPVNGPVTSTPPVSPKPQPVPVRIPISTPSSSSKSSPTIAVPSSPALSTISTTSRSSLASLSAISSIEDRFTSLTSAFTFPEHLEFAPSASSSASALLYTATNAPVRVHEQALTRLLTDLDAVESGGDSEVRKTRKELVRRVESVLEGLEAAKETAWAAFKDHEAAKDANEEQAVVEDSASTQEALSEAAVDEATPSSDTAVEEILPADTMVADNENSAPAITDDAPTVAVPSTETMETVVIPEDTVPESIGTVSEVLDSSPLEPSTLASEDLAAATPVVADTEASAAIPSPVRRESDPTINASIEEPIAAAEELKPEPELPAVTEEDSNTVVQETDAGLNAPQPLEEATEPVSEVLVVGLPLASISSLAPSYPPRSSSPLMRPTIPVDDADDAPTSPLPLPTSFGSFPPVPPEAEDTSDSSSLPAEVHADEGQSDIDTDFDSLGSSPVAIPSDLDSDFDDDRVSVQQDRVMEDLQASTVDEDGADSDADEVPPSMEESQLLEEKTGFVLL